MIHYVPNQDLFIWRESSICSKSSFTADVSLRKKRVKVVEKYLEVIRILTSGNATIYSAMYVDWVRHLTFFFSTSTYSVGGNT